MCVNFAAPGTFRYEFRSFHGQTPLVHHARLLSSLHHDFVFIAGEAQSRFCTTIESLHLNGTLLVSSRAQVEYMASTLLPALSKYFKSRYSANKTEGDAVVAAEIYDYCDMLVSAVTGMRRGDALAQAACELCRCMAPLQLARGRIPPVFTPTEQTAQTSPTVASQALISGYKALYEDLALELGIKDLRVLIGKALQQLAILLSRDTEAKLYEPREFDRLGQTCPDNPKYRDLAMAVIQVCHVPTTSPGVLADIMRVFRACIYVEEPGVTERFPEDCEEEWALYLNDDPAEKENEPKDLRMRWLQKKYDAMGVTVAALKLMEHPDKTIQVNALRLLLTLLQVGSTPSHPCPCILRRWTIDDRQQTIDDK